MLTIRLDDQLVEVAAGATVLAALALDFYCRKASDGTPRGPLCGMGVCHECGLIVDGERRLACATLARQGMEVRRV